MQILGVRKKRKEELVEETLLEQYNQYYRLAYSYVHNEADAGDIVQNGAYKAIRSSAKLEKEEYVKTWLYRIMLNEIFSFLRQPKLESYDDYPDGEKEGYREDTYEDLDLRRALESLPVQDRAVVNLRFFEEKTLEEIADMLGENLNTVKSRLYRSIRKLRIELSEET